MSSSGRTVTKRFLGPGCYVRARMASEILAEMGFDITAVEKPNWKHPKTWFSSKLESCFDFGTYSEEYVLEVVRMTFLPFGWKLYEAKKAQLVR